MIKLFGAFLMVTGVMETTVPASRVTLYVDAAHPTC